MALTFGFYNSLNGDRKYDAYQFGSIFEGVILDGVYQSIGTAFNVQATTGLNITVGTGRAWFNKTWTLNDSAYPIAMGVSDLLQDRFDEIVIEVDTTDAGRKNTIKVISGTPSATPVRPALKRSVGINQYSLAYILRKANSNAITQADITQTVGTGDTPFVTSPLKAISVDQFMQQWSAQWNQWFDSSTRGYSTQFSNWMNTNNAEFRAWFDNTKSTLSGDVAMNLARQIIDLRMVIDALSSDQVLAREIDDAWDDPILDSSGGTLQGRTIYVIK